MSNNDHSSLHSHQLTPKQEELITALLSLPSIAAAAKATGIGDKTARRWLKLEHFQEAYKTAQATQYKVALAALKEGVSDAIRTLRRNMTSEDVPPATQVRAAQIWLEQAMLIHRVEELEQKNLEIERRLEALGGKSS